MNGKKEKKKRKDGGNWGALPLDSLSSCSMGNSYAGGENALEAGNVASLMGKRGALCINENGKLGYWYLKLLKNWIQSSDERSSAEHAKLGRSSPSLSPRLCIS